MLNNKVSQKTMEKQEVKIEFCDVRFPYRKVHKDIELSVNGKEVRVYVNILHDEAEREYENEFDISESDAEALTEAEYEAAKEWCENYEQLYEVTQ